MVEVTPELKVGPEAPPMKYAPIALLLIASAAQAHDWHWEWRRQPVTAEDRAEIKRVAKLTPQYMCDLEAIMESERMAMNQQTMMQYNRMLPIPLPTMPTPVVPPPPVRGFHRLFN
jgi:hypothetical protein